MSYSTLPTVILTMQNNTISSNNTEKVTALILLDLSTTFDTIGCDILFTASNAG